MQLLSRKAIEMSMSKRCSVCKKVKLLKAFCVDNTSSDRRGSYCKTCAFELNKAYYGKNKEQWTAYAKKWREEHPEKTKACSKKYREEHPERILAGLKRSYEKRKKDPKIMLSQSVAAGMYRSLKGSKNGHHWEDLVDYTLEDLMTHLGKLFKPGMTLENHGKWHIDHKVPIAAFSFAKPEDTDFKRCWTLANLQPLWALENREKGSRY